MGNPGLLAGLPCTRTVPWPLPRIGCCLFHIPSDLVVDRWSADDEGSSCLDFRFLHDVWSRTPTLRLIPLSPKLGTMPPSQHMLEGATPWCHIISSLSSSCSHS